MSEYSDTCACDHVRDEHGGDPDYPGSTACAIDGCDCVCFDAIEREE